MSKTVTFKNNQNMKNTLSKLTEGQRDELIRYTDRMFYAAIHEGFDSKSAGEMAAKAAERKAKEMAQVSKPGRVGDGVPTMTKTAFVTHQRGSWRWQNRYALVEYVPAIRKRDGKLVWRSNRVLNDKVKPNQVCGHVGSLHNTLVIGQ